MTQPILWVTGGRGMLGRNLAEHPSANGWKILSPDRIELDLLDAEAVRAFAQDMRPNAIIHAAGKVGGVHANLANPVSFLEDNLRVGLNVVRAAMDADVKSLLNIASINMYPADELVGFTEDLLGNGALDAATEGYGLAKLAVTRMCQAARKEDATRQYCTLIPCNLYGKYDHFEAARSHFVPSIIHKVHTAKQGDASTIDIWGDGTARRECLYAGDLAGLIFNALDRLDTVPEIMNVGTGSDHSMNAYYSLVAEVLGWQGEFVRDLTRPTGVPQKLASVQRQLDWGWTPPTALADGIAQTYSYYLERVAQ